MPRSLTEVVAEIRRAGLEVTEQEVAGFVQQSWVLVTDAQDGWYFDEADTARVKLIVELKRDLDVNDEALPVVLKLLDQLYGLHQVLDDIREAVEGLPPTLRRELEYHLARVPRR
ncbi:MAG TPA: chaperone modulator CbpM [Kiloniellales bacterium]|nr:chaperone modulator CbpM [Kiloniellales bacterium]